MRRPLGCLAALLALGCEGEPRRTLRPSDAAPPDAADAAGDADVVTGIGLRCSDERDLTEVLFGCRGGQRCYTSARGFPGGYCTQDCLAQPCPADSFCLSEGAVRYCIRRCTDDAECRSAEGYVCTRPSPTTPRGCLPDPAPTGTADGGPCLAPGDAGGLPGGAFVGDGESASRERPDSDAEAEPSLAVSPVDGSVALAYLARDPRGTLLPGVSRRAPDGQWSRDGRLVDREFTDALGAVIAYDRRGTLWASYLAVTFDLPIPSIRLARSGDGGAHWESGRSVEPPGRCVGGCDPPWMAIGPAPAGAAGERFHVVYLTRTTRRDAWVTAQHADGGAGWSEPRELGGVAVAGRIELEPAAPTVHADAAGAVHVAWVMRSRANARAALGDPHNRVQYAASRDHGGRFGAAEVVSGGGEAVVAQPPQVAVVGDTVHVLYVAGEADGRWDVRLASRGGEGPWRARTVNDDARCATHGFAALVGDPARSTVHVVWLDNRYGDGEVAAARCPADPALPCGRNERVSGARFPLSTTGDLSRWHGTRAAAALGPDGAVWFAWSDTRSGGPAIYLSRAR